MTPKPVTSSFSSMKRGLKDATLVAFAITISLLKQLDEKRIEREILDEMEKLVTSKGLDEKRIES